MSETLGEALLVLRTDDSGLNAGMDSAEAKARDLGATFDRTSAKSGALSGSLVETGGAAKIGAAGMTQFEQTAVGTGVAAGAASPKIGAMSVEIVGAGVASRAASVAGGLLAGVLTGGISIAVGIAIGALSSLVTTLFEAEDAENAAKVGADGLAEAQSALGQIFDATTGKIKSQNERLLVNARLTAINLRKEAMAERQSAIDVSREAQAVGVKDTVLGWLQRSGREAGLSGTREGQRNRANLSNIIANVHSGAMSRDTAMRLSETQDFTGVKISREEFQQAIVDSVSSQAKTELAAKIDKSLNDGSLDPSLRKTTTDKAGPKPKKPPKDHSEEIAARNATELGRLGEEETRARLDLTSNIDDRADLQMELLGQERAARTAEIEGNKDLTAREKAARLAFIEKLYGNPDAGTGANGDILVNGNDIGLYGQAVTKALRDRETALANDALSRQADALSAQAGITTKLKDRDALESKALDLQQQIQRNLLDQQIANGQVADADQARAALAQQQLAQRTQLGRSQQGPLAAYARGLNASADNIDAQVEGFVVDEIEGLRDSLHNAIEKVTGTDDPLINGLIGILVDQLLLRPLANALANANQASAGGGGGLFGSIIGGLIGSLGGAGTGSIGSGASHVAMSSGFSGSIAAHSNIAGARAMGGPIAAGNAYLVGERGPEIVVPQSAGYVVPNGGGGSMGGGKGDLHLSVSVNGARGNTEIREMVKAGVQQGIAGYDRIAADRVQDHLRRFA